LHSLWCHRALFTFGQEFVLASLSFDPNRKLRVVFVLARDVGVAIDVFVLFQLLETLFPNGIVGVPHEAEFR